MKTKGCPAKRMQNLPKYSKFYILLKNITVSSYYKTDVSFKTSRKKYLMSTTFITCALHTLTDLEHCLKQDFLEYFI